MWCWRVLAPTVSDGAIRPLGPLTSKRQGRGRLTLVQGPFQAAVYARKGRRSQKPTLIIIQGYNTGCTLAFHQNPSS